jgi:hypothetical protein
VTLELYFWHDISKCYQTYKSAAWSSGIISAWHRGDWSDGS